MQIVIFSYILGAGCGIVGAVYRYVLAYEFLNGWFRFGDRYEGKWFYRPVWGCAKCFSGQLALWFWSIFQIVPAFFTHYGHIRRLTANCIQNGGWLILGLLIAISAAIVTTLLIEPNLKK